MALVEYEVSDRVATIRMNRPERLNAFSEEMIQAMAAAFDKFRSDDDAWVGILTGNGRAFSAGRDLKAEVERGRKTRSVDNRSESPFFLVETDKPIIAAVNGYAIGVGFYLALGCDIRVAAESAQFGMGEIPTGLLGPYWLSAGESLPWAIAAELTLVGERLPAQRALDLRLINEVVADGELMEAAMTWARKFVKLPPLQVRRTKSMMTAMRDLPTSDMLAREYQERKFLDSLEDTREAALAFVERREPQFHGR